MVIVCVFDFKETKMSGGQIIECSFCFGLTGLWPALPPHPQSLVPGPRPVLGVLPANPETSSQKLASCLPRWGLQPFPF